MGGGEPTRKRRSEEERAAGEGSRVERGEEKGTISKRRKTTKRRGATAGRGGRVKEGKKEGERRHKQAKSPNQRGGH